MKVIYKESILSKINNVKVQALKDRKVIEKIILNEEEWDEFIEYIQKSSTFSFYSTGAFKIDFEKLTEIKHDNILLVKDDN